MQQSDIDPNVIKVIAGGSWLLSLSMRMAMGLPMFTRQAFGYAFASPIMSLCCFLWLMEDGLALYKSVPVSLSSGIVLVLVGEITLTTAAKYDIRGCKKLLEWASGIKITVSPDKSKKDGHVVRSAVFAIVAIFIVFGTCMTILKVEHNRLEAEMRADLVRVIEDEFINVSTKKGAWFLDHELVLSRIDGLEPDDLPSIQIKRSAEQ